MITNSRKLRRSYYGDKLLHRSAGQPCSGSTFERIDSWFITNIHAFLNLKNSTHLVNASHQNGITSLATTFQCFTTKYIAIEQENHVCDTCRQANPHSHIILHYFLSSYQTTRIELAQREAHLIYRHAPRKSTHHSSQLNRFNRIRTRKSIHKVETPSWAGCSRVTFNELNVTATVYSIHDRIIGTESLSSSTSVWWCTDVVYRISTWNSGKQNQGMMRTEDTVGIHRNCDTAQNRGKRRSSTDTRNTLRQLMRCHLTFKQSIDKTINQLGQSANLDSCVREWWCPSHIPCLQLSAEIPSCNVSEIGAGMCQWPAEVVRHIRWRLWINNEKAPPKADGKEKS